MEFFFLFIGLGFFLYVIFILERADEKRYERKMAEMREFGFVPAKRWFRKDTYHQ